MSASTRPLRLSHLLLLGLLVAVLHGLVLSWLRAQLPQFEPLAHMAEPLFTRMLQPTATLPVTPAPAPASAEPSSNRLRAASPLMPFDAAATAPAAAASSAVSDAPATSDISDTSASVPLSPSTPSTPSSPPENAEPDRQAQQANGTVPKPNSADPSAPPVVPDNGAAPANARAEALASAASSPAALAGGLTAASAPAAPPPTDTWPASTRLSYTVTGYYRGDLHGSARVQWQRDTTPATAAATPAGPKQYQVQLDLYALGITLFTMTSQGELGAQGLMPKVYEERRPGGARRVWFEGASLRLDDGRRVPLPGLAQDTASQFVELGHRFGTGREVLQVGREIAIWLARPGGVDLWTYDVVGEETLKAGQLGNVAAFRLKPRPLANPRGNVTAEIWFAPSLQFLPVRVRITMGQEQGSETFVDLMVERIEQASP